MKVVDVEGKSSKSFNDIPEVELELGDWPKTLV